MPRAPPAHIHTHCYLGVAEALPEEDEDILNYDDLDDPDAFV